MSVSVRAATSAAAIDSTLTVTQPTGTLSGDLLLAIHFGGLNNTATAMTGPTGFTQLGSTFADPGGNFIKVWSAPGSTTAPYLFGGSGQGIAGVLALNGANATTPIDAGPVFNSGPALDAQIAPSVVPTTNDGLLICGWCCAMGSPCTYLPERNMTEWVDPGTGAEPLGACIDAVRWFTVPPYFPTGTRAAIPQGAVTSNYAAVTIVIAP